MRGYKSIPGDRTLQPPRRLFDDQDIAAHPDWPSILPEVPGLFERQPLTVWVKKLPLQRLVGVIVHEYAHNWQFTGGRPAPEILAEGKPFLQKLPIEGFARQRR